MKLGDMPAFPRAAGVDGSGPWEGMTLRQYYAGLAMQGFLARGYEQSAIARKSLEQADALLKELEVV